METMAQVPQEEHAVEVTEKAKRRQYSAAYKLKILHEADAYEFRARRADGEYRWILSRAVPLRDELGHIIRWYGASIDIDDRKQAEQELRKSEEQWRDVFENNPTMYFMVDAAGTVLSVNPFGAEQLGYQVAELVDQPVLSVFHESDREAVQRNMASCLEQLGRARSWEARKVRKDGKVRWVRETAKAVPRVNGPIVLVACEDITEQKRAEEALRQAQADLAHVSRVTTMGKLTASLANEVNQPIAAAVTNANACLRWLAGDIPNLEEARAAAMRIVKDGKRAAGVISRIRLLFKKGTPEREQVDVNEVIREMIVLLRSETTRYSISVRMELAPGLPRSREIAADHDEPQHERHRCDEGCGWGARPRHQIGAGGKRAIDRVRQRYRGGAPPAAGGPDLQCILYDEASWDRHGTFHQPLHRRIARRPLVGRRRLPAGRMLLLHPTHESRGT